MRATIIGADHNFEVIAEEFKIEGTDERFIVHFSGDVYRRNFVATHLETSQVIGDGETIDKAIENGRERWLAQPANVIEDMLAVKRAWVASVKAERGMS